MATKSIFDLHLIEVLSRVPSYSKLNCIDISNKQNEAKTYNFLLELGLAKHGRDFLTKLIAKGVKRASDFTALLTDESFIDMLQNDSVGKSLVKKIKYPSASKVKQEMKKIAEEYRNNIVEDITTVEDLTQLYVIRTQTGNGPVIFVTGVKSDEGRHEIRRWYSYQHKVNYFQVRECSYEYWANHPETQDSTN